MSALNCSIESISYRKRQVLADIHFSLEKGEKLGVIGPSGVGKSTLLRIIAGFHHDYQGQLSYNDRNVVDLSERDLRRDMSFLFQQSPLLGDCTVGENLELAMFYDKRSAKEKSNVIAEILTRVHLTGLQDIYPDQLSGGMKRRVGLAVALIKKPCLLLCDEPFAGQDPLNKVGLVELLHQLQFEHQFSMVLVSHDVQEALSLCEKVLFLADGKMQFFGSSQQVLEDDHPRVRAILQAGGVL